MIRNLFLPSHSMSHIAFLSGVYFGFFRLELEQFLHPLFRAVGKEAVIIHPLFGDRYGILLQLLLMQIFPSELFFFLSFLEWSNQVSSVLLLWMA